MTETAIETVTETEIEIAIEEAARVIEATAIEEAETVTETEAVIEATVTETVTETEAVIAPTIEIETETETENVLGSVLSIKLAVISIALHVSRAEIVSRTVTTIACWSTNEMVRTLQALPMAMESSTSCYTCNNSSSRNCTRACRHNQHRCLFLRPVGGSNTCGQRRRGRRGHQCLSYAVVCISRMHHHHRRRRCYYYK